MCYLVVRHKVADYEKWRPFYDGDDVRRRAYGATGVSQVYRDMDDPNTTIAIMEWDTPDNALKFAHDPELAAVMEKAGVIGQPSLVTITSRS
ncbi:MAG TPA: hypothetical protein VLD65_06860 [Anaerolineales bacterium]|nr:hypothetical protein [Anaerolineales bacterium]